MLSGREDNSLATTPSLPQDPGSYRRSDDVLFEDFGDSIIVSATESSWFTLRGTAATIWRLLDTPTTIDELVSRCVELYNGPEDFIRADLAATLEDWAARGLIAAG